jgi:hypothetical protein
MRKIRFTIGGLMAVVLVLAIDFAALRSANATWAGVLSLLTHGALGVAILGIVLRKGAERAWWLGFFVFGWGYLRLSPWGLVYPTKPPTLLLLEWLRAISGSPPTPPDPFATENLLLEQVDRHLWALPAALLGGLLARAFFASTPVRPEHSEPNAIESARRLWSRAIPLVVIGLAALVLIRSVMAVWWMSDAGLWAGGTYLLTCGLLGIATLGALLGRGRRREIWIGVALFGLGYQYLAMVSRRHPYGETIFVNESAMDPFLRAIRPLLPPGSAANARVLKALERPIPMRFPDGTSLADLLDHVKKAAASAGQPDIPIYVDPFGLQEAERSLSSTVRIDLEGLALRTTLDISLRQIGLYYYVEDGCLRISSEDSEDFDSETQDPYRVVGHCLLALIAAVVGGVSAPLVAAASRDRPGSTEANEAAGTDQSH